MNVALYGHGGIILLSERNEIVSRFMATKVPRNSGPRDFLTPFCKVA